MTRWSNISGTRDTQKEPKRFSKWQTGQDRIVGEECKIAQTVHEPTKKLCTAIFTEGVQESPHKKKY